MLDKLSLESERGLLSEGRKRKLNIYEQKTIR